MERGSSGWGWGVGALLGNITYNSLYKAMLSSCMKNHMVEYLNNIEKKHVNWKKYLPTILSYRTHTVCYTATIIKVIDDHFHKIKGSWSFPQYKGQLYLRFLSGVFTPLADVLSLDVQIPQCLSEHAAHRGTSSTVHFGALTPVSKSKALRSISPRLGRATITGHQHWSLPWGLGVRMVRHNPPDPSSICLRVRSIRSIAKVTSVRALLGLQ